MKIRIEFTGRNYHQSGAAENAFELPDGATLPDAIAALSDSLPADVTLPASCLIARNGAHVGAVGKPPATPLQDGDELLFIAPVAGG